MAVNPMAGKTPDLPPPSSTSGPLGWVRENLFATWYDSLMSLAAIAFLFWALPPLLDWALFSAHFAGDGREACTEDGVIVGGACWTFVKVRFGQFMYGFYPAEERWRVDLAAIIVVLAAIPMFLSFVSARAKAIIAALMLTIYPCIALWLFYGGNGGWHGVVFWLALALGGWALVKALGRGLLAGLHEALRPLAILALFALLVWIAANAGGWLIPEGMLALPIVETSQWGGLFLTMVVASTGIVVSLPLGVLLALGRRSDLPVIKAFCVVFIELWRGVPLITVLFMASVMFPLFLPEGMNFDKLLRALIGVALFASAYMAEVVRGGLQAIPKGQSEAASALGLSYWQSMGLIVLPQALKMVIPGIVNTFIGLFKDTTLVLIIGLFDLLGIVQAAATDPEWLGFATEGYVFAAFGFWVFCFGMSRYSQRIEAKLDTGHKKA